ncbi:hypothetical protein ES703_48764 [subsurface metagenome]
MPWWKECPTAFSYLKASWSHTPQLAATIMSHMLASQLLTVWEWTGPRVDFHPKCGVQLECESTMSVMAGAELILFFVLSSE